MERGKFSFKIKIVRAYYIERGSEHPVNIPYLEFTQDGNVTLEGEDQIGPFSFSGKASDDYLFLEKKYHGKHTVFYAGKLEKNHLYLHYDFKGDYPNLISKVTSGDFNAGIVFDAELYNLFLDGNEFNVFFAKDDEDDKKLKGLGMIHNKVYKLVLKKKSSDEGKLKLKYDGDERKLKIRIDSNNLFVDSD